MEAEGTQDEAIAAKTLNKTAMKSGVWYTVASFLIKGIGLISAPIFTRLLDPSEYGQYSNIVSWMAIISIFSSLCLPYSIASGKSRFDLTFESYIASIQVLSLLSATLLLILGLVFLPLLVTTTGLTTVVLVSIAGYLCVSSSLEYAQSKFRFQFKYRANVAISLYVAVATVVVAIVMIGLLPETKYFGRLLGDLLPSFILSVFLLTLNLRALDTKTMTTHWRHALRVALPLIPHALSMVVLAQVDKVMLMKMRDSTEVGLYSFGYSYAFMLTVFSNAIVQAWTPWLVEKIRGNADAEVKEATRDIVVLVGFLTFGIVLVGPEVLALLGTEPYQPARWVVAPLAIGAFSQFLYNIYATREIVEQRTAYIGLTSMGAGLLNAGLNLILIPAYGYLGAALATLASYVVLYLSHLAYCQIVFPRRIYDNRAHFAALLAVCLSSALALMLYDNMVARIGLGIGMVLLLAFLYRKKIGTLIRNRKLIALVS